MEFFAIADKKTTQEEIQQMCTIEALPLYCASIESASNVRGDEGVIFCIWGRFIVRREKINGGVRFTMPECPNAFQWTVTTGFPPAPDKIVVHGTVNRTEHDPDFVESMEEFFAYWKQGLECHWKAAASRKLNVGKPTPVRLPMFSG